MTRNCNTHINLAGSLPDDPGYDKLFNNLLFIAISGPANHELLSYQYIVCASQVFQLVYQTHKPQLRVLKPLDHCTF